LKGDNKMSKISDMMIQYVLKGNAQGEAENIDVEFDIPHENKEIRIRVKCEKLTIQIEKARD